MASNWKGKRHQREIPRFKGNFQGINWQMEEEDGKVELEKGGGFRKKN